MGFSTERGDSLNVVNTPFMSTSDAASELPFWQKQAFFELMVEVGRWLLVLLVAWIVWRKLVRPQFKKREEQLAAANAAAQMRDNANDVIVKLSKDEEELQRRSQQRINTGLQSQRIRDLAENDPRVVALVIRQWMSTEL